MSSRLRRSDVRKGSAFSEAVPLLPGYARNLKMFTVSKDTQALYITAVAKDRLPIFQSDAIKKTTCAAIDEAIGITPVIPPLSNVGGGLVSGPLN